MREISSQIKRLLGLRRDAGISKILSGETTIDEVLRATVEDI